MKQTLNEIERRVLGVLIEKALTGPEYYPMTLNALVAGCNQKSNRNPVMDLDESTIFDTLEMMRDRELVALVLPGPGSRVNRYKHNAEVFFDWQKRECAVMAELMLRGPQTTGELRTRCNRMVPFDSIEAVSMVIDALTHRETPMVKKLPRGAGQSADRYGHLLTPADESDDATPSAPSASPAPHTAAPPAAHATSPSSDGGRTADELRQHVAALKAEIADLNADMTALKQRLEALEQHLATR